jgi:aminopeptidase N
MKIYARKSLINLVEHETMFTVTAVGMRFYEDFFGKSYPFRKYDIVFTPEHNFGAMENVGCVTMSEDYLYRGRKILLNNKIARADV